MVRDGWVGVYGGGMEREEGRGRNEEKGGRMVRDGGGSRGIKNIKSLKTDCRCNSK